MKKESLKIEEEFPGVGRNSSRSMEDSSVRGGEESQLDDSSGRNEEEKED